MNMRCVFISMVLVFFSDEANSQSFILNVNNIHSITIVEQTSKRFSTKVMYRVEIGSKSDSSSVYLTERSTTLLGDSVTANADYLSLDANLSAIGPTQFFENLDAGKYDSLVDRSLRPYIKRFYAERIISKGFHLNTRGKFFVKKVSNMDVQAMLDDFNGFAMFDSPGKIFDSLEPYGIVGDFSEFLNKTKPRCQRQILQVELDDGFRRTFLNRSENVFSSETKVAIDVTIETIKGKQFTVSSQGSYGMLLPWQFGKTLSYDAGILFSVYRLVESQIGIDPEAMKEEFIQQVFVDLVQKKCP